MKKMKIHTWDIVRIIAGKNRYHTITDKDGATLRTPVEAKVLRAYPSESKVLVEWVNIVTKHVKKQGNTPGQKVQFEKPIHVSNVMLVCPTTKKPTRIRIEQWAKTSRISVKSGKPI